MESLLVNAPDLPVPMLLKQERDESIVKCESGIFSVSNVTDSSANSSDYNLGFGKWECIKGEVVDPVVFDPPCLQNDELELSLLCNISSISGDQELQCKYSLFVCKQLIIFGTIDGVPCNSTKLSEGLIFGFLSQSQAETYNGWKTPLNLDERLDSVTRSDSEFVVKNLEFSWSELGSELTQEALLLQNYPFSMSEGFHFLVRNFNFFCRIHN